jgi:group II intron reverse transcriptase/maturase
MGLVFDVEGLRESFECLDGGKAPGVDGMKKEEYRKTVDERLSQLSQSVRKLSYRPRPVRRVYIPKSSGGRRPLGISCFEDKIVQDRVARILMGIWEPQFCDCSYGYRPQRGATEALKKLTQVVYCERTQYLVEADIKGFFNNVSHEHMEKFLRHRINDPMFLRLINRFLKAGVLEDGVFQASEIGTPQGGLVSPVLSNIYLHYVLDLWFEKRFRTTCRGKAYLIRYCDDFVACFEFQEDAERFHHEMPERLGDFALEVEPTKTKILAFGADQLGNPAAETFTFLGFTHFVARSRGGRFKVGRKTDRARMRKKLQEAKERLKLLRSRGQAAMITYLAAHLRGHYAYYGVSENSRSLWAYYRQCARLLFKWLNRRSQRNSIDWSKFSLLLRAGLLPKPKIVHSFY